MLLDYARKHPFRTSSATENTLRNKGTDLERHH